MVAVTIIYFALDYGILESMQNRVVKPPQTLVETWKLSPFYEKWVDVRGLPVLGSGKVSDYALLEAAYLATQMLKGRDDVRKAMIGGRVRIAIMAYNERTIDIPEHSDLTPKDYWNRRARGLGATPERPAISGAEENLLSFPGDPYKGENIFIHEFSHAIHEMGLRVVEKTFDKELGACFAAAKAQGLWVGTYALTNSAEYWAEGVQSWFDCNARKNANHNGVCTREALEQYDPALATLIRKSFRNTRWRYVPVEKRIGIGHLVEYDTAKSPTFVW
jgi:hypothetical protein